MSPSGLYTAPAGGSTDTVTATWVADKASFTTTTVYLTERAQLTSLDPAQAAAGQTVHIHGKGIAAMDFFFTGVGGALLKAKAWTQDSFDATVVVPDGVRTGPVFAKAVRTGFSTNSQHFTRLPNIRVRAVDNELSSSESIQMQWRALGPGDVPPVTWISTSGTVDATGRFWAPNVTSETFVRVTGCFQGTSLCDGVLFRVNPVRVVPHHPQIGAGAGGALKVKAGEALLDAEWANPTGIGSIAVGVYSASNDVRDAGPVPVTATLGGEVAEDTVLVKGQFPGIVHRVHDFIDELATPPQGWSANSVFVIGNRAYVQGKTTGSTITNSFVDVFDVTDPSRPVWIDATESVFGKGPFYKWNDFVYQLLFPGSQVAVYQNIAGTLVPLRILDLPPFQFMYYQNVSFDRGKLYAYSGAQMDVESLTDTILVMDVSTGYLSTSTIQVPLPPEAHLPVFRNALGASANRLALGYTNGPGAEVSTIPAVYDISVSPPRYMGLVRGWDAFKFVDSLLFTFTGLYDLSGTVPVEKARTTEHHVDDVNGNLIAARDMDGMLDVLDVSDPSHPQPMLRIHDVTGQNSAWAGDMLLTATTTGGLTSISVAPSGGPVLRARPDMFGNAYDMVLDSHYAYVVGTDIMGAALEVLDISGDAKVVSQFPIGDSFAIRKKDDYLFVGKQYQLSILKVASPTAIQTITGLGIPTAYLALSGNTLFAATFDNRVVAVDVSQPERPSILGEATLQSPPITIRSAGGLIFVADKESGLLIYNFASPSTPTLVGSFPCFAVDVVVDGNLAFVAGWDDGVWVLDISNPAKPVLVTQLIMPTYYPFYDMGGAPSMQPYRAYTLATNDGLLYVDTLDPSDEFTFPPSIVAYDYRTPSRPRIVTSYPGGFYTYPVFAFGFLGQQMFTAGGEGNFVQYDLSHPRNSIEMPESPNQLLWWTHQPKSKAGKTFPTARWDFDKKQVQDQRYSKP